MEYIKKEIKQAITTESSTGNTFTIIPDLAANYHMQILLTTKSLDLGFFDAIYYEYPFYEYPFYGTYGDNNFSINEPIGLNNL